jgi:hypothetical protein
MCNVRLCWNDGRTEVVVAHRTKELILRSNQVMDLVGSSLRERTIEPIHGLFKRKLTS